MPWQEIAEKLITVGITALVSGAGGYVIAALKLKKTLTDSVAAAEKRIADQFTNALAGYTAAFNTALQDQKNELANSLKLLQGSFEKDLKELKEDDLKAVKDAWSKGTHDLKGEFTRNQTRIEQDLHELEKKVDSDARAFNEEQTKRWNEVQRSLGYIEGQLKSSPRR